MGPTRILGLEATRERVPGIATSRLSGGILYHDAQFNDARFALVTARAAIDHGATVLNYVRSKSFLYGAGRERIQGALVEDLETGETISVSSKAVINATGIFSDAARMLDQPGRPELLSVSRGSHIVIPHRFLGGSAAVMVPKTEDGRVIFAIPWQGVVLVGTTDIAAPESVMEPKLAGDEVDYLLRHIAPYLNAPVAREDILSVFSGLRPLVTGNENKTSKLSREHHIDASSSGLITIAGGKWTTYRRMAEDTLDFAIRAGLLERRACVTNHIALRGCPGASVSRDSTVDPYLAEYGTDLEEILALQKNDASLAERIDSALPYSGAMVVYAVRHECARTVEDVLSRRTRSLLLNARAAMRAAPRVAQLMAEELHRDDAWQQQQIASFRALAQQHYLP